MVLTVNEFNKFNAKLSGYFFIIAAVSSVIGLKLYDPVLNDSDFLTSASRNHSQIILGAFSELILAVSAAGTGIMLSPVLKRYNESMGLGYLSFRLLEVVFIIIGTLSILTALSVSQDYAATVIRDEANARNLMQACISLHKWTFILGPNFMLAVNTCIYSYVFIKSGFVPKNLAILGILASCLIMLAALLEMFGIIQQISFWGILLAVPIALYEMTLAVWLILKGFIN